MVDKRILSELSSSKVNWEFSDRFLDSLYNLCKIRDNTPEEILTECFTTCGMLMMEGKLTPASRADGSFVWVKSPDW